VIAIHVDPDTVMEELEALHAVHAAVARRWRTDDILIMGDFNADTKYISRKRLDGLRLRVDEDTFSWLIDDDVDTTTADNDYTYDRYVRPPAHSLLITRLYVLEIGLVGIFYLQCFDAVGLGGRKGIRPVKTEWWDVGVVVWDEAQTCI